MDHFRPMASEMYGKMFIPLMLVEASNKAKSL